MQTHSGLIQTIQQTTDQNGQSYRSPYHQVQDYYNNQNVNSTGAVPRTWHQGGDPGKVASRANEEYPHNAQMVSVQIESKDALQKEQKGSKAMTKTYHTIKDIISSRFKSSKDAEDKIEEPGLNNVAEELRKSQANISEEAEKQKPSTEQQGYDRIHFLIIVLNSFLLLQVIVSNLALISSTSMLNSSSFNSKCLHSTSNNSTISI